MNVLKVTNDIKVKVVKVQIKFAKSFIQLVVSTLRPFLIGCFVVVKLLKFRNDLLIFFKVI